MAIKKEYTVSIGKRKSVLNKYFSVYKSDIGVSIHFKLYDCPYLKLSNQSNLLSRVILKDPFGKQITSDVMPIINNVVVFTLTEKLMNQITETGKYQLYILIMDDKENRNLLPPIEMDVLEEINLDVVGLGGTNVESSPIDNSTIVYGNDIRLYNADGTYNRTIWSAGDIVTSAKMNKLEQGVSDLIDSQLDVIDKVEDLRKSATYVLVGEETNPIIITDLQQGFYIISGYVRNFKTSNIINLDGSNYFFITYNGDTYSNISRCLTTDVDFKKYKYDKNLATIYSNENQLVTCRQEEGYIAVSEDKYQFVECNADATILLPSTSNQLSIELSILVSTECVVKFDDRTIVWNEDVSLEVGKLTTIRLTYVNNVWYGKVI